VVQLRDELVPPGHLDAVLHEAEVLGERLERARLVPEFDFVNFVDLSIAGLGVLDECPSSTSSDT
jgi:hypothetical protein